MKREREQNTILFVIYVLERSEIQLGGAWFIVAVAILEKQYQSTSKKKLLKTLDLF